MFFFFMMVGVKARGARAKSSVLKPLPSLFLLSPVTKEDFAPSHNQLDFQIQQLRKYRFKLPLSR